MSRQRNITLYLTGDFDSAEFTHSIGSLPAGIDARYFVTASVAIDSASSSPAETFPQPNVIVVAQQRPGAVRAGDIERLHTAFPLAQLIVLLGAWCEGEMRTGRPLAGVTRVFWHAFPAAIARLTEQLRGGRSSVSAFPRIAGAQERVLREMPPEHVPPAQRHGVLLVRSSDLATFESLAHVFERRGYACAWLDPRQPVRYRKCHAILWDASRLDPPEWHLLTEVRNHFATAPMLLLTGFPRREDMEAADALGVGRMLAKPFLVEDLLAAVDQVAGISQQPLTAARAVAG